MFWHKVSKKGSKGDSKSIEKCILGENSNESVHFGWLKWGPNDWWDGLGWGGLDLEGDMGWLMVDEAV